MTFSNQAMVASTHSHMGSDKTKHLTCSYPLPPLVSPLIFEVGATIGPLGLEEALFFGSLVPVGQIKPSLGLQMGNHAIRGLPKSQDQYGRSW
jgi:hypothetical protein